MEFASWNSNPEHLPVNPREKIVSDIHSNLCYFCPELLPQLDRIYILLKN